MWTLQYHHFAREFWMIKTKPVKMDGACYLGKSPGSISFSNIALHRHYKKSLPQFSLVTKCHRFQVVLLCSAFCVYYNNKKKTWNKTEIFQRSKFLQCTFRCIKCFKSRGLQLFTLSHSFRLATYEVCWLGGESRCTCKDIGGVIWLNACTLTRTRFHSSQWMFMSHITKRNYF